MVYNVGLDDLQGTIAKTWGEAGKIPGIPTAFVIGRDGKIAAITHPMNLDQVLPPIITPLSARRSSDNTAGILASVS